MKRLADGVYGVVSGNGSVVEVRSVFDATVTTLAPSDAADLSLLATGQSGDTPLFRSLHSSGRAVSTEKSLDARFAQRLGQRGASYRWHLAARPDPGPALGALRRARARFKLAMDPWRGSFALPECVVARCQQALPRRGRVLALWDVSLATVALAALGHHVTVVEHHAAAFLRGLRSRVRPTVLELDVTRPVEPGLVGTFDAVFLEPPAGALRAGLDRAALFCRAGGTVSLLAPPSRCAEVDALAARMGLARVARMQEHTAVILPGLIESPLRLDHHLFRREGGGPTLATEPCPWTEATPGMPDRDDHCHLDLETSPVAWDILQPRLQRALDAVGAVPVTSHSTANGVWSHWMVAFPGGGHLAAVHHRDTGLLAVDVFPFHQALQDAIQHMVLAVCPPHRRSGVTSARQVPSAAGTTAR